MKGFPYRFNHLRLSRSLPPVTPGKRQMQTVVTKMGTLQRLLFDSILYPKMSSWRWYRIWLTADTTAASHLALAKGERVVRIRRVRLADSVPISFETYLFK